MSNTNTTTVRVIRLNEEPLEIEVAIGTTIGQLAERLGIPGGASITALDASMEPLGPNHAITADTRIINFVYKLAGA